MFPGLPELIGSVVGGVFRLGTAFLEAREKERDRAHELDMTKLHGEQAMQQAEASLRVAGLQADAEAYRGEMGAVVAATTAQAASDAAAGGFAAKLSASVRPVTTYYLLNLYGLWMAAQILGAWVDAGGGVAALATALRDAYGTEDRAMLSTVITFWFVVRAFRRGGALGRVNA